MIADYKENFKIPITVIGRIFFGKTEVSCLTFVCHIFKGGEKKKIVYTYLSEIITHNGFYTLECAKKFFKQDFLSGITSIKFWSDGGPHFKCREFVYGMLDPCSYQQDLTDIHVNFFAPCHGKSEVDGQFGVFTNNFKCIEGTIDSMETLREFFEVTLGNRSPPEPSSAPNMSSYRIKSTGFRDKTIDYIFEPFH